MSVQGALELTATVGELPTWETHIEVICPGRNLTASFEREPLLPGVILTQNHRYRGMISRRRYFERMSRPYSQEIFTRRPIEILHSFLAADHLILAENTPIIQATRIALQRSPELVYEPVVVQFKSAGTEICKLLDFHQLLLDYCERLPTLIASNTERASHFVR